MRKVVLNLKENMQYEIIKKLVETNGNKKSAAIKLNCTPRHINRLIKNTEKMAKKLSCMVIPEDRQLIE